MHQHGNSCVDLYIVWYAESFRLDTAVCSKIEDIDRRLRPKLKVFGITGDVEDIEDSSQERAGSQGSHYAVSRRQRRKYKTACLGLVVRNGFQEEFNGDC